MSINLLPWREINLKSRTKNKILSFIVCALCICFFSMALKYFLIHESIQFNKETAQLKDSIKNTAPTHLTKHQTLLKQLNATYSEKNKSIQENNLLITLLSTITIHLPNDIILNSLQLNQKKMQLQGISSQLSSIHQYNSTLQQSAVWKHMTLTDIHNDRKIPSAMHFTLELTP